MSDSAFFVQDGEVFLATEHTRGPWSEAHQHGGPPAALLAHCVEAWRGAEDLRITRVTVDFAKPVPIGPLSVSVTPVRAGRKVVLARAEARHEGAVVLAADFLLLRARDVAVPPMPQPAAAPPFEGTRPWAVPFFPWDVGYHTSLDARVVAGGYGTGHMTVWLRPRMPIVLGERTSGVQRALLFADAAHGLSAPFDFRQYTFINPDLTLGLLREPEGEWLCMDARSFATPHGIGHAHARHFDLGGEVAFSAQSLVVDRRTE